MAAVSYLENIDTRPVEYKPYKLPYQAFMQEFAAKNQYFAEGAAQVQQAYKNVLGLNPLFKENKEHLKAFMDKAEKDLAKAVKSDMTITDNSVNAANVFSPIFDQSVTANKLLLTDSELNKFYQSEQAKAEQARTTSNGKTWNRNNEFYFQNQYQKYKDAAANGESASTIEDHYQKRKGFIPYYDVLPDLEKVKKLCHEDSRSDQTVNKDNYLLFSKNSLTGVSSEKMQDCLGFLPDAAKQQIGINSYAQYYGNKEGLMKDYKSYFVDRKKEQFDVASAKYAAASSYTGKDPKALAVVQALKSVRDQKELELKNGTTEWNQMLNGQSEKSYIDQNYDNISSVVGNIKFTERGAIAMSWQEVENAVSANAAGIAQFKQQGDIYMQKVDFINAQKMAEQKQGYEQSNIRLKGEIDLAKEGLKRNAKGEIVGLDGIPVESGNSSIAPEGGREAFEAELDDSFKTMGSSLEGLTRSVITMIDNNPNLSSQEKSNKKAIILNNAGDVSVLTNFIDVYDKLGIKDPMVEASLKSFNEAKQDYADKQYSQKNIEKSVPGVSSVYELVYKDGRRLTFSNEQMKKLERGEAVRGVTKGDFNASEFGDKYRSAKFDYNLRQDKLEEAYKTKWATTTKYFHTPETTKQESDRLRSMYNQYQIPEDLTVVGYQTDMNGNRIFKLSKEVKDTNGDKSYRNLTKDEMKALNLPQVIVTEVARTGNLDGSTPVKDYYFKTKGGGKVQSSTLDTKNQIRLTKYTEAEMPKLAGEWSNPKDALIITNSLGEDWKITVGAISEGNNQVRPIFKTQIKINGNWVTNSEYFYSIEEVNSNIENKNR